VAFSPDDFRRLFADRIRHEAMTAALRAAVIPGSVVVDLGSGPAIYGFLALQFGASHVYAIDTDPSIVLGRQLARQNGLEDRITFLQSMSFDVELPVRADVIVGDLRDSTAFYRRNLDSFVDAKRRFLKPGGVLIPATDRIFLAPISSPSLATRISDWTNNPADLDATPALELLANQLHYDYLEQDQIRSTPQTFADVVYGVSGSSSTIPTLSGTAAIESAGALDAIGIWFETLWAPGVVMKSGPNGARVYRTIQLPIHPAVNVDVGDKFSFNVKADFTGEGYRWSWSGGVEGEPATRRNSGLGVLAPNLH
jgi:type I protein arginine methyltransferase